MNSQTKGGWKIVLVALFASLAATGCKNVQPNDLTGTWTIEDGSRQVLPKELQNAPAKIILNPDGTFSASSVPAFFYIPDVHPARLETGSGYWKLISHEGSQQVQLNFVTISNWDGGLPYGTQLNITDGISAASLYYFLGDPDQGRRISFTKQ